MAKNKRDPPDGICTRSARFESKSPTDVRDSQVSVPERGQAVAAGLLEMIPRRLLGTDPGCPWPEVFISSPFNAGGRLRCGAAQVASVTTAYVTAADNHRYGDVSRTSESMLPTAKASPAAAVWEAARASSI
jgi:hypothetical protein